MNTVYHSIIQSFPKGYTMAFAYGSGVMKQMGHNSTSGKMMDFTFVVKDPLAWHTANLRLNPGHYSALRHLGPGVVTSVQRAGEAGVYYNTLVPTHEGLIKYGVISRDDLIADMLDWRALYVAGRLHKPVLHLCDEPDPALAQAQRRNLASATRTALLLLPERFTEQQFYERLARLSYAGDVRMRLAEDRNKVRNIVSAQLVQFRALYAPSLYALRDYVSLQEGRGVQDSSVRARYNHLSVLPLRLQSALVQEYRRDDRQRDVEDVLTIAAQEGDCGDVVASGISSIVRLPSLLQAIKGVLTAGLVKAVRYGSAKVMKRFTQ